MTQAGSNRLWSPPVRTVFLFGLTYLLGAECGHWLSFPGPLASFWPPNGFFVAALLVAPWNRWTALAFAGFSANFISDVYFHQRTSLVALGFAVVNTIEALAGTFVYRHFVGDVKVFDRLGNVLAFVAICGVARSTFGATFGAAMLMATAGTPFEEAWVFWWAGDLLGILVVAPAALAFFTESGAILRAIWSRRILEFALLLTCMAGMAHLLFGLQTQPVLYLLFPFLVWSAIRFEATGVSITVFVLTLIAVGHTIAGSGPFAFGSVPDQIFKIQGYLGFYSATALVLAVIVRERRFAAEDILASEERYRDLIENMDEHAFSVAADGRFLSVNHACRESLQYSEDEILQLSLMQIIHAQDLDLVANAHERSLLGEKIKKIEMRVVTKSGQILHMEGSTEFRFREGEPIASRSIFRDVTERKAQELRLDQYRVELEKLNAKLEVLSVTDGLTGLKNRRAFEERLQEEVERAVRYESPVSLMMLDVDYFKKYNDSFGHPAGDELLRLLSRILDQQKRSSDFVARYGGEEFVLILPSTDKAGSLHVAARIRALVLERPWPHRNVTVSIGVATLSKENVGLGTDLVSRADRALYHSKQSGRNRETHCDDITDHGQIGTSYPLSMVHA